MRRLPDDRTRGIVHSVTVKPEDLDKIGDALGIAPEHRHRLRAGHTIDIVREAGDHELKKD